MKGLELDFKSPDPGVVHLACAFRMIFPVVSRSIGKLPKLSHPQMMSKEDTASRSGLHFSLVNLQLSFSLKPPK